MAKINPKAYAAQYKDQSALGGGFVLPPKGIYHAVNTILQFQTFEKGTKKLRIKTHILKAVEGGGEAFVSKSFFQDIWWNFDKEYNSMRISLLGQACTADAEREWDPDNKEQLIFMITGNPYLIRIDHEEKEYKGKKSVEIRVMETKELSAAERKKYKDNADWNKIVGKKDERLLPEKAIVSKGGGGGSGGGTSGDPFETDASPPPMSDDDIPF